MSGPLKVTITLHVPIMHGDQEITELELVEPTFESLQQLDRVQGEVEKSIRTICACTALPPSVIRQLRARDFRRISELVGDFMGEESPPTGGNSALGSPTTSIGRRPN